MFDAWKLNSMCGIIGYIGEKNGREGVKLEQQVIVRGDGIELMSHFPFEDALL